MKEIIVIAHDRDLDGLGCHAIMRRYADLHHLRIKHYLADYTNYAEKLHSIAGAKGFEIVIADLGYSEALSGVIREVEALSRNNTLRWFDHHDWSEGKAIRSLNIDFVIESERCASELVQSRYLAGDEVASKIASLAHSTDYMLEDDLAWKLYDLIASDYDRLELVDSLSRGIFWSDAFARRYQRYQKTKAKAFAALEKHWRNYKVAGLTVTLGFSGKELSSTIAANYLLKKKGDIAICLWENGKISFRRNNRSIDLGKLARHFRGGGHAYAAGGFYSAPVKESNYLRAFEEIVKRLEALL